MTQAERSAGDVLSTRFGAVMMDRPAASSAPPQPEPPRTWLPAGTRFPTVCGTGHRTLTKARWAFMDRELTRLLPKLATDYGTTTIISGMARGYDLRLAEQALLNGMNLLAFIPFEAQTEFGPWTDRDIELRDDLLAAAERVVDVSKGATVDVTNHRAVAGYMHRRNRAMLRSSQAALACWDPANHRAGTFKTIGFAIEMRKPIILINLHRGKTTIPYPEQWPDILTRTPDGPPADLEPPSTPAS